MAQYRYEQQYLQRTRQHQARWDASGNDPYGDQYFHTPANYRYAYRGGYRQTYRHGADLMRQAVDYGYREGLRAGRADRQDGGVPTTAAATAIRTPAMATTTTSAKVSAADTKTPTRTVTATAAATTTATTRSLPPY